MTEILFDKICYFKGVIDNPSGWLEEANLTDDKFFSAWKPWESNTSNGSTPWVYGDRKFANIGSATTQEQNLRSFQLVKIVLDAMEKCAKEYGEIYKLNIEPNIGPSFVLNKYNETEQMGQHVDWNEDQNSLEYSFVVYLNDDYEGGELWFEKQDVCLKPEAGSIVIFPSKEPYFHGSKQLVSGRKIFIPHFWRNGTINH